MQNKGVIWTFIGLFSLACLYQLSFTWVASSVEDDAQSFATKGNEVDEKIYESYLDSMRSEEVYPLFGFTYGYCKAHEINLGLDLKGGMNVTLEVAVPDILTALAADPSNDEVFQKTLQRAKELQKERDDDFVSLFNESFNEVAPDQKMVRLFRSLANKDQLSQTATNEEVILYLRNEVSGAIDQAFNVLRTRVNQFGIAQPNIQKLIGTDRILVELPGVKDKERVRKLLQGAAKLEFWETYDNVKVNPMLVELDKALVNAKKGEKAEKEDKDSTDVLPVAEDTLTVPDTNNVVDQVKDSSNVDPLAQLMGDDSLKEDMDSLMSQAEDSALQQETVLFKVLGQNVFQQNNQYYLGEGAMVGYAHMKDTGKVNKYLHSKLANQMLDSRLKFAWGSKPVDEDGRIFNLYALKASDREGNPAMDGDVVTSAYQDYSPITRKPVVMMNMNAEGTQKWKNITGANVGKQIAIVLDGYVQSAPNVEGEIPNGSSSITGVELDEAQDLANVLKAGRMPAPAKIVEEAVVGPSLGKAAISAGLNSFIIALLIVLVYMVVYYGKAGGASDIALLSNMFFIIGVLASTNIALTLPGIAGIVLTIGMSVDANVLIYERIREELAAGKGLKLAIADGYKNAYSSIIDANVTTLLTGAILWFFGTGPIEGFAKTLVIGILTSLFSAIFITRLIFTRMLDKKQSISFSTKMTEGAFRNVNFDFLGKRKIFYGISGVIILAGLVSLFTRQLDMGVDFTGGRNIQVLFEEPVSTEQVADALGKVFIDENGSPMIPEVKTFGGPDQVMITTNYLNDSENKNASEMVEEALSEGLNNAGLKHKVLGTKTVGPTIADDIKTAGVYSIIFSLIVIFLYILLRFRRWQFGLGALIAIFHDVLIVLSVFSLFYGILPFSLEIDQAFIAAILTVVGYSINDTVVVFDRIREYLGLHKKQEAEEVVNKALNSTLSRTINTSLSTIFVLLMIFIFGGDVIRGFSFALLIGVIVGTYSSLCVATPVMVDLAKKKLMEHR